MISPKKALKDAEHALRDRNDPALARAIARTALRLDPCDEARSKLESLLLEIDRMKPEPEFDPHGRIKSRVYHVVGTGFEGRAKIIRANCEKGTPLKLEREPKNRHDELAVAVYVKASGLFGSRWKKIGYLSQRENEDVARLLDAGRELKAEISKLYAPEHREFPKVHIRIGKV